MCKAKTLFNKFPFDMVYLGNFNVYGDEDNPAEDQLEVIAKRFNLEIGIWGGANENDIYIFDGGDDEALISFTQDALCNDKFVEAIENFEYEINAIFFIDEVSDIDYTYIYRDGEWISCTNDNYFK